MKSPQDRAIDAAVKNATKHMYTADEVKAIVAKIADDERIHKLYHFNIDAYLTKDK